MLAWIRSPRGSTATATAVAVILALFWYAPWQKPLPFGLPTLSAPGDGTSQGGVSPPSAATAPTPPAVQQATTAPVAPAAPSAPAAAARSPLPPVATAVPPSSATAHPAPTFDVVRVQPNGDIVIAGRGEAGADVDLMDGSVVVGHGKIDESGQFALLPPALPAGSHYLTLRVQKDGTSLSSSSQSVAVTIAGAGRAKPLVALLSPDKPTQVLSDGSTVAPAATSDTAKAAAVPVAIQTVEASPGGKFMASGVARAGSQCHIYLNGAYLADVTAGQDGHWSVEIKKGMAPGRYTVRADEVDAANGKVVNRAEVPFDYLATLEAGKAKDLMTAGAAPGPKPGRAATAPAPAAIAVAIAVAPQPATSAPASTVAAPAAPSPLASVTPATPGTLAAVGEKPAAADMPAASAAPSPSGAVIADLSTTTVVRGDSLWRISRKMLGHGIKYTEIYASNASQIRNPSLIYPGQVFVVPAKPPT